MRKPAIESAIERHVVGEDSAWLRCDELVGDCWLNKMAIFSIFEYFSTDFRQWPAGFGRESIVLDMSDPEYFNILGEM